MVVDDEIVLDHPLRMLSWRDGLCVERSPNQDLDQDIFFRSSPSIFCSVSVLL